MNFDDKIKQALGKGKKKKTTNSMLNMGSFKMPKMSMGNNLKMPTFGSSKGASPRMQSIWKSMGPVQKNTARRYLTDTDGDRVPNKFDCSPFNTMRQDEVSKAEIEEQNKYYQENKDKFRQYKNNYIKVHKEKIAEQRRKYREEQDELIRERYQNTTTQQTNDLNYDSIMPITSLPPKPYNNYQLGAAKRHNPERYLKMVEENKEWIANRRRLKGTRRNKLWQNENSEKWNEYRKQYREEHKEEIKEKNKKYLEEHKEEIYEKNKKYREEHREEINEKQRKYYENKNK